MVLPRHELTPRSEPFGLRHGQQLSLVTFPLDIANDRERNAMPPEHAPHRHKAHQAHEEVAHAAGRTTDIRHLAEYDFELIHHVLSDFVQIREMRAFAQRRLGQIEALAHGGFHCAAMRQIKWMDFAHAMSSAGSAFADRPGNLPPTFQRFIPQRSPRSPAPFAVDGFRDHHRQCGFISPEHLAANGAVGHDLASVGQKRSDLDQMLEAEAGGGEHRDDVAPGLLALRLKAFGHAAVRFFRHLAADEQQPAMLRSSSPML